MDEILRVCSICRIAKPLVNFGSDKTKPLGKEYRCLDCEVIRRKQMREKMKLTPENFKKTFDTLPEGHKKIYSCIPFNNFAHTNTIFAELKRIGVNRSIHDLKRICLELVESGFALTNNKTEFKSVIIEPETKDKPKTEKEFDLKAITKQVTTMRSMADALANQVSKAREVADNLELAMVYMIEIEELAENKSTANDKEFQAFLAFKAAIKG